MAKNPKSYVADRDVYVDHKYYKVGEPFVTTAPKGDGWEEKTPEEVHIIEASVNQFPADPPLEGLGLEALRAVAVTKNVNTTDLSKKQLIDAIKAADEPRL